MSRMGIVQRGDTHAELYWLGTALIWTLFNNMESHSIQIPLTHQSHPTKERSALDMQDNIYNVEAC
eukprot:14912455-Ditylum_brightwellii.AAC.2